MPKKQSSNSTKDFSTATASNPQIFLLKFIQRNYERREIDEQSFRTFNKFAMMLGKQLSKQTTLKDVQGFVMMVRTVFQNFQELNKNKFTFSLYIQLVQIYMEIFERAVSLDLSKEICCEFLDIFWTLYESQKKQQSFNKMEQKFAKINMPKQMTEQQTMTKINEFSAIPQLQSLNKYENFINYTFLTVSDTNSMRFIMESFMNIEGDNYFDSILKTLQKCIQQTDYSRFAKLFKICMCIGDNLQAQNNHILIILPKILMSDNKIQFLFEIFQQLHLEKLYSPNKLFYVCINILDSIFSQKNITDKSIWLIQKITKFVNIFKMVDDVTQQDKLLELHNKILQVLFSGKKSRQVLSPTPKIPQQLKADISKQKSNDSPLKTNKGAESIQANQIKMQKKQSMRQQKNQNNKQLQPLKPEQIEVISREIKKILLSLAGNERIYKIIIKTYKQKEERMKQFMRLCTQNVSHINSECLQLILSVYVPLISGQEHSRILTNINRDDSALIKVVKLRIVQHRMGTQKNGDQEIFSTLYKETHLRLVSEGGTNFDYLALTVLHEHMSSLGIVIKYLISSCLDMINSNSELKSAYFRCNTALLASILDLHHNISIKLSYNKFKLHANKLNNKFSVQDFISVNQIKENKLFVTGPRVEIGEEKQQQLLMVGQFLSKLFRLTQKLGDLINLPSNQQSSYYYMLIIELCSLCMQKIPKLGSQSQQIQTIIKMRKNNKFSLLITIGNQLLKKLENIQPQLIADQNSQIIIMHLLMKFEQIFNQCSHNLYPTEPQTSNQCQASSKNQKQDNTVDRQKLQMIASGVNRLIEVLGNAPKLQTLRLINKSIQVKQQQSLTQQFLNFPIDEIETKKNKLKDHMKHFHIIKYYSEAYLHKQMLLIMIIKSGVRIIQKISQSSKEQNKQQIWASIRQFQVLFQQKSSPLNENLKKVIQIYIKVKILMLSSMNEKQANLQQIKSIIKYLEQNHDQVSQIILEEQNKIDNIENQANFFKSKTNFMRYLFQKIVDPKSESTDQSSLNLALLDLLKILIDNNNKVLDVCNQFFFLKLSDSEVIPELVLNRVKKSIQILKQLQQKNKQSNKKQIQDQKIKVRKLEKEEQKMLEESKKIYAILAKMLQSMNSLKLKKQQNILKMIGEILELDDYSDIFISIQIIREVLNILPLIKCLLPQQLLPDLADRLFGYLMAIRQIYQGITIQASRQKGMDQGSYTISAFINYFVEDFYSKYYQDPQPPKFNDSMVNVVKQQKQTAQTANKQPQTQNKQNAQNLQCVQNQKRGSFRCLKCDSYKQLCINCITVCHKNHPIVYVQPAVRSSKSCQCSQQICKINSNFKKLKQTKEKKKQKIKQYNYKVGSYQPYRGSMEQFAERYRDYRDPREPRESQDPRQLRDIREIRQPRQFRDIRDSPEYYLQFERQLAKDIYQQQFDEEQEMYNYISNPRQNNDGIIFSYSGAQKVAQPPQIPQMGTTQSSYGGAPNPTATMRVIPNLTQQQYSNPMQLGMPPGMVPAVVPNPNSVPPPANLPSIFTRANDSSGYVMYGRGTTGWRSGHDYGARMSQQEMERIIIQKQQRNRRERQREKENLRLARQREKYQVKNALLNSRGGLYDEYPERFLGKNQISQEQDIQEEQNQSLDKFEDENYQQSLAQLQKSKLNQLQLRASKNQQIYDQTVNQSYLLPIFMEMAVEICQKKEHSSKQQQPEIGWHIKLASPITSNPNIVFSTQKMCPPKTFHTKLGKNDVYHESPAPLVSKTPIAVADKFVFILSGPKISIHLKQQLLTYLLEKNEGAIGYPPIFDVNLHFEPHSISMGHQNMVCIAGLHNVVMYEFDSSGRFVNADRQLRHSVNNNNINKIKLTHFGVFVGLSREVRLLNHSLQQKAVFKMPDALVKQWCVLQNSPTSFVIYITISDGYIFYAEGNMNTAGEINFVKKVTDSRTNRPVGFFVLTKKVDDCGTLMLSTFKDKSIGHSLGRLSNDSTLTDINYIKLNSQGLQPIYEKYNLMGLSDMVAVNGDTKQNKQLYVVTIYKEQNHDNFSLHRGLLGIIKIKQDGQTGFSKYQTQILCGEQQKCEYFEIVWLEDKKNWFILSLHEDGSLKITVPIKINKNIIQKQLISIKEKKLKSEKHDTNRNADQVALSPIISEQNQLYNKLSKSIKERVNLKTIKDSLKNNKMENNEFLSFIQNSDLIRAKEDYSITSLSNNSQAKTKLYEIKLLNKKKIMTGLCFFECSDVILPTRKIQNVFQIGFTFEQSLHFYAFGSIKIQVRKRDQSEYSRDQKNKVPLSKNIRDETALFEQRLLSMGMAPMVLKNANQISVYGELFQTVFKNKIPTLMKQIEQQMNKHTPFELTEDDRLSNCLQNCDLLLTNCIQSNNLVISQQQSQDFAIKMKERLIGNKQKINLYNKLYPQIKRVIYKCLKVHQLLGESKIKTHVFNDKLHPLRFATQAKIHILYENLAKGEISDNDLILLVNELYAFVCGSLQQDVGAVNQQSQIEVLLYFLAKYPVLLYKLHKKVKVVENAKILYRLIPLYLFHYVVTKYLSYHNQWVLPALCEIVGKNIISSDELPKPSVLSRFLLYKYLKIIQSIKLQAWLKNVEGIDALECLKEQMPLGKQPIGGPNGNQQNSLYGGLSNFGLMGQYELQDQQALLNKVMELSKMDEKLNLGDDFDIPLQQNQMNKQQQKQMEESKQAQGKNVSESIKDLIEICFKQVDYEVTNLEQSCQKVVVIFVIFKLGLWDQQAKTEGSQDTLQYLCLSIQSVIQRLCTNYHQIANQNTHYILMMWLNLFGLIYQKCHKDSPAYKTYESVKQEIIATLNKFKIEHIRKLNNVPNLFVRRIKGQKLTTKADFIYGFISVLQKPCQANFVLLTLGCYWLFPHDKEHYNKTKYIETVRENQKIGNIKKIYETALTNIEIWKQVGDPEWLAKCIQEKIQNWPQAIELLALYYEQVQ